MASVLAVLVPITCAACAAPTRVTESERWQREAPIYLIRHGWHTGIAIRRTDISIGMWPEARDFPQAQYLEVGWGEADFYQARRFDLLLALKAALLPNPSVLHVVGLPGPVEDFFAGEEIVELRLSQDALRGLVGYVSNSYARPEGGRTASIGPGLYGTAGSILHGTIFICSIPATVGRSPHCVPRNLMSPASRLRRASSSWLGRVAMAESSKPPSAQVTLRTRSCLHAR